MFTFWRVPCFIDSHVNSGRETLGRDIKPDGTTVYLQYLLIVTFVLYLSCKSVTLFRYIVPKYGWVLHQVRTFSLIKTRVRVLQILGCLEKLTTHCRVY